MVAERAPDRAKEEQYDLQNFWTSMNVWSRKLLVVFITNNLRSSVQIKSKSALIQACTHSGTDCILYLRLFLVPISTTHLLKPQSLPVPISHRQVSIKCAAYFPAVAVKTETGAQMSSFPSRENSKLVPPAPPPLLHLLCHTATLKVSAHCCAIIEL